MANFMNSFISQCVKPNGKVNVSKLHELTSIPISTIYKLMKLYPKVSSSTRAIMPIASEKKIEKSPKIGNLIPKEKESSIMPIASENFLDENILENYFIAKYGDRFLGIQEILDKKVILCVDDYDLLTVPIPYKAEIKQNMRRE